jgi:hypothetical protein
LSAGSRISIKLTPEEKRFLTREYGSPGRGLHALVRERMKNPPMPSRTPLKHAYLALKSEAEAPGEIRWLHALEIVCKELGVTREKATEILRDLCAEDFLRTTRTGWVAVGDFREWLRMEMEKLAYTKF